MSIEIKLHPYFQEYAEGQDTFKVEGRCVGECLEQLFVSFPGIKTVLFNNENKLLDSVDIMVNNEEAYPEELAKTVQDGARIYIMVRMGCLG